MSWKSCFSFFPHNICTKDWRLIENILNFLAYDPRTERFTENREQAHTTQKKQKLFKYFSIFNMFTAPSGIHKQTNMQKDSFFSVTCCRRLRNHAGYRYVMTGFHDVPSSKR